MVSRENLKSDYQQQGGVCLLASYAFLLEYAGVFSMPVPMSSVYDVLSNYTLFHSTLVPVGDCYSAQEIENEKFYRESSICGLINGYCKTHEDIAGYQQIAAFHNFLVSNHIIPNWIEIVDVQPPKGQDRSNPISDAYDVLSGYLEHESEDSVYAALILYLAPGGAHTVFLGFDGNFFIRDSNYTHETGESASFGFSFNEQSMITEYMVFRIKKKVNQSLSPDSFSSNFGTDKWTVNCWYDNFVINNHGMKLVAKGEEGIKKVVFDPERKTVQVVVTTPVLSEKAPRIVDLSEDVDFFEKLRNNIEEVLTTSKYYKVTANGDRTVFDVETI